MKFVFGFKFGVEFEKFGRRFFYIRSGGVEAKLNFVLKFREFGDMSEDAEWFEVVVKVGGKAAFVAEACGALAEMFAEVFT